RPGEAPAPGSTAWRYPSDGNALRPPLAMTIDGHSLRGRLLVLDGPDGCGKSTQLALLAKWLRAIGAIPVTVREPGGTAIGERIRDVLLDPACSEMDLRCEMLLYMASRAQLCRERIRPALAAGRTVIADRFISSTLAYQGTAGGLAPDAIAAVGEIATEGLVPDLTVILDVDETVAAKRLSPVLDRIEQRGIEFHRRVRQGYLEQVRRWPDRHEIVDTSPPPDVVFRSVETAIERHAVRWNDVAPTASGRG
ncbi:MAG: dTMP kinase, partial [Planctomycetota bacterium]